MLQDCWDEFLTHKNDEDSESRLKKFLEGVQTIEEVNVKDALSQLRDPVSVGELVCKQLLSRFGSVKRSWMIDGLPDDVRLLLAAVDRFSQAGFVYNSRLCDNLLSMLEIFTKAVLTKPSDVVLPLPSYRLSSLWHAQGHWSSVARFVIQLKLNQCSQTDDVSDSWMDGLLILSVLEGILANTMKQPSRGKQRGELVQRSVNKLMELFTWMVFKQSTNIKFEERRVKSPSPDIDEPDVDVASPVAPFRESFMSVTLLVLSAMSGLLLKHYDTAVELRPLLKQLVQCITGVAKTANAHLEDLLSRPESSLVGNVNECLTYINNAFLCIASCLSLNFCINEQLCSTLSAEFVVECLEKAGMFEALISSITHASVLSSLPALPEARQTVLPLLSKLIRLSFMFLPKVSHHQEETEDRRPKKGAQVKQTQLATVADMLTSPLVKLRPRLVDVMLIFVENSSSQHLQTHILSELSMRRYRSLVTLPHVLESCLKNFSNFHSSAQGIVLQFLHNCLLDNTYVASCADKSRAFRFYLQVLTEPSPSVAIQVFSHLQSLAGRGLPAVVSGIIQGVVLPLLSQFDSSSSIDLQSGRQMLMADIQQGGKEYLLKGAFSLLVQSLDTLSIREQCSCIQLITLERFRFFLSVLSVQSDCLKVLGHFTVGWKSGIDENNEYWIRTVHDYTVKLLFDLCLSDVTLSHSMVIELDKLHFSTVQLYAAIGSHVASLLWRSDFLFEHFREVSGPVVVAGQAARMLTALSSCSLDQTVNQPADPENAHALSDNDQTVVAQSDVAYDWQIIFSYVEAQLKLMSRSSQYLSVNYYTDTIGIIQHYKDALIYLVCQYPSGLGCLCNLLIDLAIASFPDHSEKDDLASEECEGDGTEVVETEIGWSSTVARLNSMQSGDYISNDSLSSSCGHSNDGELGWSGYAADISFSECEMEASGRDYRISSGPSGPSLLFPELTPLVVHGLARICKESIDCHAIACLTLKRLTSIAQSSSWNLHLLTEKKLLQAVITEFEYVFAGEENKESGLTGAVLSLLTTLGRNSIDSKTSSQLIHIISKPSSHRTLLISSLINMLQRHHVPSCGAILGRGLVCQVGSNVVNNKKSSDSLCGSITLPLKPISWIPASVGFSMSLWLRIEQQRCLLYHETEWTDWLNDHRGMKGKKKSVSKTRRTSLQSDSEDQDDAATVTVMSCGVDRCKFQIQAVQRKGSMNASFVSRWSGKHSQSTSPDGFSLGMWHHLVATVSGCEVKRQSRFSKVCVYVDGKLIGDHRISCPRAALQGTPVTCCIGGWSVQGVSLQVKNEPEQMKMKLPITTNTRSLLLSSGSFCFCKGVLSEDEVGHIYSSGPDGFKFTSSCHDRLAPDSLALGTSGQSVPLDVIVKEKLEVLYCPTSRLATFYQFHLPQEIERMPSALAVFFHTTYRPMSRTLAIEPTAVKASVSPDVCLSQWMGFKDGLHHVGGIASILVLVAKVVGSDDMSPDMQSLAAQLFLVLQKNDKALRSEFMNLGGYSLLRRILCCPSYKFGMETVKVLFDAMCDTVVIAVDELSVEGYTVSTDSHAKMIDIDLLCDLLLDNSLWMKCDEETLTLLFSGLSYLIGAECQQCNSNKEAFINGHVVELILQNCHVREVQSQGNLPSSVAGILVTLMSSLMSPPNSTVLIEICNFLVAAHKSPAVRRTQVETTDIQILSKCIDAVSQPQTSTPRQQRRLHNSRQSSISSMPCRSFSDPDLRRPDSVVSLQKKLSDTTNMQLDQSSNFGNLNDSQSTYSEVLEDFFSWESVIGTPHSLTEYSICEYDNASLSTGLLATLRGQLVNLPDSMVRKVLEENFDPKMLLPLADHTSEMQRAAVLKILDIYFTRGRNVVLEKFQAINGFHLLSNQIGYHECTMDILFMSVNLFLGCPAITSVESLENLDTIAENADCRLESFVLLLTILGKAAFGSDIIHAICLAIGKLLVSVPGLCYVATSDGLVGVVCSLTTKCSKEMLEDGENEVIMDVFGDLKQLTQSIVMSCCWSGNLQMFKDFVALLFLETSNPNVNLVSTQLLFTLLHHVIVVAFGAFRVPGSGNLLSDKSKISFMEKRSFSEKLKTFQLVCKESIDLIVYSMWNVRLTDTDRAETNVDGNTLSTARGEPGKRPVSAEGEAFACVVLGILTEAMIAIVDRDSAYSAEGPHIWMQLVQSSEAVIRVQFGRLLCHLLSPRVPLTLRHSVLSQLEIPHLKNILASMCASSLGKRVANCLLYYLQNLFEEDPSLKCARDPDSKTVGTKMVEQIMKSSAMQKRLSIENVFGERLPSNLTLAKANAYSLKKEATARISWIFGQKEIVKWLWNQFEKRRKEIAMHADSVTDDVFKLQSTLKAQMMGKIKARQMAELQLTSAWRKIVISTTHERTPLFEESSSAKHWQLDPTEGPDRIRKRLQPSFINIGEEFYVKNRRVQDPCESSLMYLFDEQQFSPEKLPSENKVLGKPDVLQICFGCVYIVPGSCASGELLFFENEHMYFLAEKDLVDFNVTTVLPSDANTSTVLWTYDMIVEVHQRRYQLMDNGLEIFLLNGKMHFFSFENTEDRNRAHHILLSHKLPNFVNYEDETKGSILKYSVTRKWQEGLMTNFQYLMHLNKMAGRTFNDLMQYPVFPYVLADYKSEKLDLSKSQTFRDLSKPISIQDESKIEKYVTNYEFLEGEYKRASEEEKGSIVPVPYHYGSHFSNSGIVLHYLVRVFPYTKMFLDYQDKHFDVPDRTFHNMESTWRLVSSESPSDVKEMIPEFYYLPEFLVNLEGFDFGQRQTGEQVSDVLLPLWAHGDERLFILKHRQALECDYVSRNLHKWIDLVFGYKQAGPAAIEAVNVFHPSTYFGAVDIERITDEVQRNAVKAQIQSYGQSPKQLFDSSHPSRTSPSHLSFFTGGPEHFDVLEGCDKSIPIFTTLPMSTTSAHDFKDKWCQFAFLGPLIRCSVGVLWSKTFSGAIGSLHLLSSGEIDALSPKMAFIQVSGESSKGDGQRGAISWGFYDGSVRIRLKGLSETYLPYWPQSKMITCCGVTKNRQLLFGDSDGVVTVWTLQVEAKSTSGLSVCEGYTLLPGHQTAILCLAVCQDFSIWVTGSQGGDCVIWDLNRLSYIRSVPSQSKPVSSIAISSTLGDIAVAYGAVENPCGHDSQSKSELLVWSINAAFVSRRNLGSVQVNCLAYSSAAEGVRINVVAAGTDLGKIRIFSSWDLTPLFDVGCAEIKRPITSVMFSKDSWELYGATTEGCVVAWKSQHS